MDLNDKAIIIIYYHTKPTYSYETTPPGKPTNKGLTQFVDLVLQETAHITTDDHASQTTHKYLHAFASKVILAVNSHRQI